MVLQRFAEEGKVVLPLVVPPSWVARLNALANRRGINRSALIRAAIQQAYFDERPANDESEQTAESDVEPEVVASARS